MSCNGIKRVVIVTGSARGIGKAIALRFGKAGNRVVVNFLTSERAADAVVEEISSYGGEAISIYADIRSSSDVDAMMNETFMKWGSLDVLVNNAGKTADGLALRLSEQAWDDVVTTNLSGAFYCSRAASKIMAQQRQGHIVNISSIVGLQGREGQANYSASKAGLVGLTKACAKELGSLNIKVNTVLPGYLPTDMGNTLSNGILERTRKENALGRFSNAQEVSEFVYQLCQMNNVSGQVFNLDSRIL